MATPHSRGASGYELDAMSFAAMSFAAMSSSAARKRDRLEALPILKQNEQMWADGRRLFQTVHGLARPTTNAGRQASAGSTAVVSAWVEAPCVPRGTCQVVSPAGQHQLAGADGTGAGRVGKRSVDTVESPSSGRTKRRPRSLA